MAYFWFSPTTIGFSITKDNCFYKDLQVIIADLSNLRKLYEIGNNNLKDTINQYIKKGYLHGRVLEEDKVWHMSLVLGGKDEHI